MRQIALFGLMAVAAGALYAGSNVVSAAQSGGGSNNQVNPPERPGFEEMLADKAEALGLTTEELKAQLDSGKNLHQIMDENIDDWTTFHDQMQAKMQERHEQHLNQLVANGMITQEQADERLEWLVEHAGNGPPAGKGIHGFGMGFRDCPITTQ